jgi:SAM-dependent methyltransferase
VDFSAHILDGARNAHGALPGVGFRLGEAVATGLPDACADVVFERALVHHVPDLAPVVAEAARLLRPGGVLLIQDRTPEDVAQPGSATHPRGWLFEVFPRLLEVENGRRPTTAAVAAATAAAGLGKVVVESLWEVRRRYPDGADYLAEIAARTGRSILHELSDAELDRLVEELRMRLPEGPLVERDPWTLWRVERPAV